LKEILSEIERWRREGLRVAIARVVGVDGSGPRDPGATMAVNERGEVAGSISGGCVEGAVVSEALESLARERPPQMFTFGYTDAEAFSVGLTCGGTIRVLVDATLPSFYETLRDTLAEGVPVALATVVAAEGRKDQEPAAEDIAAPSRPRVGASILVGGPYGPMGSLGNPDLDRVVVGDASGAVASGQSSSRNYGICGQTRERAVTVFIEAFSPPPRMLIFGAVDFATALARVAKVLGYRVTVCDARAAFATEARFPMADEVTSVWPHIYLERLETLLERRDAICVLTHDPKFDVPVLAAALRTRAGYLGALGSRRTHRERCRRLLENGADPAALERIMGPIGLDIGAETPEETAISICAEIIARRTQRPAPSLRDGEGAIHAGSPQHSLGAEVSQTGPTQ
jgi:xanthine dehydrogenase accessory factor